MNILGPGAENAIIDASGNDPTPLFNNGDGSRVINISDGNAALIPVWIAGLTLTGGDVSGNGGAINSIENLTLIDCMLIGNSSGSNGGAIFSDGDVAIDRTRIRSNRSSRGGGIYILGFLDVSDSTISGNHSDFVGGAIIGGTNQIGNSRASTVILRDTTISDNVTGSEAGGVFIFGSLTVSNCTISGNTTKIRGGGVQIGPGSYGTITNSTISGNSTTDDLSDGGGVYNHGRMLITSSTITGNATPRNGGGIYNQTTADTEISLVHTIIAGNTGNTGNTKDFDGRNATSVSRYNLIGDAASAGGLVNGVNGNIVGMPIQFILNRALTDNGGPTLTHALTVNSVALDAGDPQYFQSGVGGIPLTDQRGAAYERIYNSTGLPLPRIDIGAYEAQPTPVGRALLGDYSGNGVVDAADLSRGGARWAIPSRRSAEPTATATA